MNARTTISAAVLLCLLASAAPVAGQSIRYVDDDASIDGTGLDWDHAYRYLQDALFEASTDPTIAEIHVAAGTYKPDQDEAGQVTSGDRFATFQMLSGVAVMGGYRGCPGGDCTGDPDERDIGLYQTVLSGDLLGDDGPEWLNYGENSYHVVTTSGTDATAVLDGLTVTAGNANHLFSYWGAGVLNEGGSPTLIDCVISANRAYRETAEDTGHGGGMFSQAGSTTLTRCRFVGNASSLGGAGLYCWGSDIALTDCEFVENVSEFGAGGGMLVPETDSCYITGCRFVDNWAHGAGGGLTVFGNADLVDCVFAGNACPPSNGGGAWLGAPIGRHIRLTGCEFLGNSARTAGGVDVAGDGSTHFLGCRFVGNAATEEGGALYFFGQGYRMINCTVHGNAAGHRGGGVIVDHGELSLVNCTIYQNVAGDLGGGVELVDNGDLVSANCILWANADSSGSGVWAQVLYYWSSIVDVDYSCIQGWTGGLGVGNIGDDPQFIDPDGPDDIPGTEDDNLRLSAGSPCIDAADNLAVPADWADLDGDEDTTERTPLDLWGIPRFIDDLDTEDTGVADPPDYPAVVDMGAYEYHVPGDLDFDGDIDGDDYWLFAAALPSCVGDSQYNPAADLDFDGCVTLADYTIWLQLYREANPPRPAPAPGPKSGSPDDTGGSQTVHHQTGGGLAR